MACRPKSFRLRYFTSCSNNHGAALTTSELVSAQCRVASEGFGVFDQFGAYFGLTGGGGGGRPNVVQFRPYRFDTTRADSTKHGWFRVNFMRSSMMTYAVCRRVRADFMSTASTIDRCILGILTSKFIDKAADRV